MKLLVDARPLVDARRGGVSRVALALVAAYARTYPADQIVCVTTGTSRPALPAELTRFANISHRHIRIPNKLWSALCFLRLIRFPSHADAVFFPNLGFIGALGSRNSVLLLHDLSFLIEPRWFTYKQRLWHSAVRARSLICAMPKLLAVSETTKRDAVRLLGIPEDRITVIPIGPTLESTHVTPHTTNRYILALGGNDPRKNIATAHAAITRLREDPAFGDLELIVPNGHPSDHELHTLYMNVAAFVYPSWYEGYGLPLHEAASCGTPRISSTAGALPETAPAGTLFANPAKPHLWVEALRIALTTPRPSPIPPHADAWTRAAAILRSALNR